MRVRSSSLCLEEVAGAIISPFDRSFVLCERTNHTTFPQPVQWVFESSEGKASHNEAHEMGDSPADRHTPENPVTERPMGLSIGGLLCVGRGVLLVSQVSAVKSVPRRDDNGHRPISLGLARQPDQRFGFFRINVAELFNSL